MKALLLSVALFVLACPATSQVVDIGLHRVPLTTLDGPWHFQTGDDPSWSDPAFDDSAWPLLSAKEPWLKQGYPDYRGVAWYRIRLIVPASMRNLALYVPAVSNSCEIFANGQLVGSIGKMPPKPDIVYSAYNRFVLPDSALRSSGPLVLAVRVWRWPVDTPLFGAGFNAPPVIGDAGSIKELQTLNKRSAFWMQSQMLLGLFANLLTALASLGLFALRPREREYLWFGIAQLFWASQLVVFISSQFRPTSFTLVEATVALAPAFGKLFNLEFFITLMGQRRRALYWTAMASIALSVAFAVPIALGSVQLAGWSLAAGICEIVYAFCVPALLFCGARKGSIDARLLMIPFTLSIACNVFVNALGLPAVMRFPLGVFLYTHLKTLFTWPFPVDAGTLFGDIAMFSVIAVLVLRFARSRRDEERLAAEVDAARAVQHVLVPDEIPAIPGLQVDCAYRPAGQVGGDFFQVLPLPDGDALIAIGDVSGKGMPAAMTVSLLVGMLRMLAGSSHGPAAILQQVNQSMVGRTPGGFITCMVLRIRADGTVTAANAGHVAPYINGKELALTSSLPLGLDSTTAYAENRFALDPEDRLTLLTDGVMEARNAKGELFGFDRAASISRLPAAEIAHAAANFGQDDDITVLSLIRRPADTSSVSPAPTFTHSPAPA